MRIGTCHFVSFTKACDYFKQQGFEYSTNERCVSELETYVREAIENGDIVIGQPLLKAGQKLALMDNGCRYGIIDDQS